VPELPEVETIARDLRKTVPGRRVRGITSSGLPLRLGRAIDLTGMRRLAVGKRVLRIRRRGKYLLLDLEGRGEPGLLVHLGMSGRLTVARTGDPLLAHTHVRVDLGRGEELRFVDPRRFGWWAPGQPVDALPEVAELGPDPLAELTVAELARRLASSRAPIKAFLLDQRRVAGLGNIYVCEALHLAGIDPHTPAARAGRRAARLFDGIRHALESGIRTRGTTLRDYVDGWGSGGRNADALRVYGREGEPCPICSTAVRRRTDSGRSTFYCSRCQR
jgi:formamidopyrimidine-DNA glycosylase